MSYNFSSFKQKTKDLDEWLKKEFGAIRTGRATPAILDSVRVEAYGSEMTVAQAANVAVEDARSLRITPWDTGLSKAIEKGIQISDLGLSVSVDDKGLRVMFPELTSDRRASLVKVAKQKLEDGRITLRNERERVLKDLESQQKAGSISEDEKFRSKTELQKMVDEVGVALEQLFNKKEKEISE